MLHISSVRFLHSNNKRYNDIKLRLEKEVSTSKKRKKTQPCTERHNQSIIVIERGKNTIYRYRKPKNRVRRNEKEGKSAINIIQLGNIIA